MKGVEATEGQKTSGLNVAPIKLDSQALPEADYRGGLGLADAVSDANTIWTAARQSR